MKPFLFLLLILSSLSAAIADHSVSGDILTAEERRWLNENEETILVALSIENYAPIEWLDENGELQGIINDYLVLMEEKLGLHFQYDMPRKLYKDRKKDNNDENNADG